MSFVFPNARAQAWSGNLDLTAGTVRAMLVATGTSIFDEPEAATLSDFSNLAETTVSGYTAGGIALSSRAIVDPGDGSAPNFEADDLSFGPLAWGSGEKIAAVLIYVDTGNPATDVPIAAIDQVDPNGIAFPYEPENVALELAWPGGAVFGL